MTDAALKNFDAFLALPHAVTLLGMSGVGKTMLSSHLRRNANWYHFSADYRIGTRYLAEHILDNIKYKIMRMADPFVADLLRSDSIYINHNITVDNLDPVSTFLGLFGDAEQGGLDKETFLKRQRLYAYGEQESMKDCAHFIDKAWNIYGCQHFINDASGSLCEVVDLDDPDDPVIAALTQNTLILYLRADAKDEEALKRRAVTDPKPLFYHPDFILPRLVDKANDGKGVDAKDFARDNFPALINFRRPRYQRLADQAGFTIDARQLYSEATPTEPCPSPTQFLRVLFGVLQAAVKGAADDAARAQAYIDACHRRARNRQS